MSDKSLFRAPFKQEDDVCLLASYSFVIEYYSNLCGLPLSDTFIENLFQGYTSLIVDILSHKLTPAEDKTLSSKNVCRHTIYNAILTGQIDVSSLHGRNLQCVTSKMLHFWCQDYNSLQLNNQEGKHGYQHIKDLDDYLHGGKSHNFGKVTLPTNYQIYDLKVAHPVGSSIEPIKTHLQSGNNALAMIIYRPKFSASYHSVVCGFDGYSFFFRDSNCTCVTRMTFNGCGLDNMIPLEYILFKEK